MLQTVLEVTEIGQYFNGYIQCNNMRPLAVAMYCNSQIELFKEVALDNNICVLHLDSTGSVVASVQADGPIFLFSLAIKVNFKGEAGLPVLE